MKFVIQIYWESSRCNAHQSMIITRDYDGDDSAPEVWKCPACGMKAKTYSQLSLAAHKKQELADRARIRRLRNWE